jgi:chromosomal replication initiation ATPase DnaA
MQTAFDFSSKNLINTTIFSFAKGGYFKPFIDFARFHNTFLRLILKEDKFNELALGFKNLDLTYIENTKLDANYLAIEDDVIFLNLPSFLTGSLENELLFLDILRSLAGRDKTFIAIMSENFIPKFSMEDVSSRFNASMPLNFESDTNFNFFEMGASFLKQNGILIEEDVLEFMLRAIDRDIASFAIFIQELKNFIETRKIKVKKSHFKEIFENYEKARNKGDI